MRHTYLNPRWRKVLADLWDNRTRTILVVSSIAVGVFSIGMIITAHAILDNDIDFSYAEAEPANIDIVTNLFDDDFVRVIERVEGVEKVEGRRMFGVQASNDGEYWQGLNVIAVDDFETMEFHLLEPIRGERFPGRREVVVTENFMINAGFETGDTIQIEMPDGEIHALPLVGVVNDQVTDVGDVTAVPKLYILRETLLLLGVTDDFNHLYIQVEGAGSDRPSSTRSATAWRTGSNATGGSHSKPAPALQRNIPSPGPSWRSWGCSGCWAG